MPRPLLRRRRRRLISSYPGFGLSSARVQAFYKSSCLSIFNCLVLLAVPRHQRPQASTSRSSVRLVNPCQIGRDGIATPATNADSISSHRHDQSWPNKARREATMGTTQAITKAIRPKAIRRRATRKAISHTRHSRPSRSLHETAMCRSPEPLCSATDRRASYGPPQNMQYNQAPYQPQATYAQQPPRQSREKGCLEACLATLCCCFVCEEGCECFADLCMCAEGCC